MADKREQVHLTVLRSDGKTEAALGPRRADQYGKKLDPYDGLSLLAAIKKARGSSVEDVLLPMLEETAKRIDRRRDTGDEAAKDAEGMTLKVERLHDGRKRRED